jgi:hypothetical protein
MVFIIKPQYHSSETSNNINNDLDLIAKMMLNIEHNKQIYRLDGVRNTGVAIQKSFNCYTHSQVDFDINVSMGVVLIYIPENSETTITIIQQSLINKFQCISYENQNKIPYTSNSYNSTTYTLINKKYNSGNNSTTTSHSGPSYRQIIINKNNIRRCLESGTRFVWLLQKSLNSYLYVPELLLKGYLTSDYLARSISTIIYDDQDLFNMTHGTKQLDYPNVYQYNMFKENRLLDKPIYISDIFGLDHEILSYYYQTVNPKFLLYPYYHNITIDKCDYNDFEIRRRNINKDCYKQLYEPFDYVNQELEENNINESGKPPSPKDVCFITGMPLYNTVYLLKIKPDEKKNNSSGLSDMGISHILVCPFIFHSKILIDNNNQINNCKKLGKLNIMKCYLTKIKRTECDAINLIPKKNISPLKREILYTISRYGVSKISASLRNLGNQLLVTANIEKNKVYIGFLKVTDADIILYADTETTMFHYRIF